MSKYLALIGFVAVLLVGCSSAGVSNSGGAATDQVTTSVVKRQDLVGYSFFDGKLVIPETAKATAFSPYDTPILSVPVTLGKHVDRGDTLVKLTIPGADAAAAMSKANAETAKANYSAEQAESSGPVVQAKQALAEAQAAEKTAKDTLASGGSADLEAATQARIAAETALKQAQQSLRQSLEPTKAAAQETSAYASAAREDAQKGLIRAPISGTVVSLEAKPGMAAKSRQAMATIINFDAARVQGLVPPELKDLVVRHSKVLIAMEGASAKPLYGRVLDVSVVPPTEGQTSQGYLATIELLNPDAMVQPATSVKRIGVRTGSVQNALVVPAGAITKRDGKSYVSVQNGDKWVETLVEVGISDGALVEIKSGLSEGATVRVVSQPANGL